MGGPQLNECLSIVKSTGTVTKGQRSVPLKKNRSQGVCEEAKNKSYQGKSFDKKS